MAHHGDRSPVVQHERIMKHLMQELSLTAQQQSEIEPIVSCAHVAILELRFAHQAKIQQILSKGHGGTQREAVFDPAPELDRIYTGPQQRWQASRNYFEAQKKSVPRSLMSQ